MVTLIIFLFLTQCQPKTLITPDLLKPKVVTFQQSFQHELPLSDSRCEQGGILGVSWIDKDTPDGIYTEGQDTDYKEEVICYKSQVVQTAQLGDIKIIVSDIPAKDKDCQDGGKLYESFKDTDNNNFYDSTVDTQYNFKKVCYDSNTLKTLTGANTAIVATNLTNTDTQCSSGGIKLDIFTDMNGNGSYESDIDTFHTENSICNGDHSVTQTSVLSVGDLTCPAGGIQMNTFTDINNNGLYDAKIDQNSSTYKVCYGLRALILTKPLNVGDVSCPSGGQQLISCIDSDGDGVCTSGLDFKYSVQSLCYAAGVQFNTILESPGTNCKAGGYKLEKYQDIDNNKIYNAAIDLNYTVNYVCHGLNKLSKTTAFTLGNGTASDNTACPSGGVRFEFGYDHINNADGSYYAGVDGALDLVEIVPGFTAYTCHGADNAGPLISIFQNDSEGTNARFNWEVTASNEIMPNIKLAYSSTKAGIQAWNCESSLAGVTVVTDFSSCTDATYRTASSGALTSTAKCGFDLTVAPFSTNPWDYRYFKLCAQNTAAPNGQSITTFRVAGNVPNGMVMVHQDEWPIHELANTTVVPFTYAIDKWEGYLSAGVVTNGTPATCTSTNCISTSTGTIGSASGQTPVNVIDWYASRKGCSNRSAAGYTGATTPRSIHLMTEREQLVAIYKTPEKYFSAFGSQITGQNINDVITPGYGGCNIDYLHNYTDHTANNTEYYPTGDVGTKNCISQYGARDMIGNYGEYIDVYNNFLDSTNYRKYTYWGTPDKKLINLSINVLGYSPVVFFSGISKVYGWDYEYMIQAYPPRGINTSFGPTYYSEGTEFINSMIYFDDYTTGVLGTVYVPSHSSFSSASSYPSLGRYSKYYTWKFTKAVADVGVRCAVISP